MMLRKKDQYVVSIQTLFEFSANFCIRYNGKLEKADEGGASGDIEMALEDER
jgi:hypothetical protein